MPSETAIVMACEFPTLSAMERHMLDAAYFQDSYRIAARHRDATVVEIFQAIFAHHPKWMKIVLIIRNRIASFCGLDAPTSSEMMNPVSKDCYEIGDKIGVWPIFKLTETELIAGRDNRHLDFRLSVLRHNDGATANVVVSTVCVVHNTFGKVYLFFVVPFHKWGVRLLISRAAMAGRL
ncbi:MAG: DUF2867 domain-containing protein [Betaproteobacteria bacterium]